MPKRPPKAWWDTQKQRVEDQYPSSDPVIKRLMHTEGYKTYDEAINHITAGIWYDYKPITRKRLSKGGISSE